MKPRSIQLVNLVKLLQAKAAVESIPTTFKEYQAWARMGWHIGNHRKIKKFTKRCDYIMAVGLGGETGEVLEVLKKSVRDGKSPELKQNLTLELGDALY
jgi:hypothetical protein